MLLNPSSLFIAEEQRVILSGLTWNQYENMLMTLGDYPGLRLIYLQGNLEIFMPSAEHEMYKKILSRLLERYAEVMDIALHGYGSTTFRQEAQGRGLEPDECYCVGTLKNIPDLAIEINLSSGGLDKLAVYQGLGVLEVVIWQDQQLTLYQLRETGYQKSSRSQFFPDLDWQLLAKYIIPQEQPQAIKDFLKAIRSSST